MTDTDSAHEDTEGARSLDGIIQACFNDACTNRSRELRRCAQCSEARYCSVECQKEDWHNRHRRVCKQWKLEAERRRDFGNEETRRELAKMLEELVQEERVAALIIDLYKCLGGENPTMLIGLPFQLFAAGKTPTFKCASRLFLGVDSQIALAKCTPYLQQQILDNRAKHNIVLTVVAGDTIVAFVAFQIE